MRRALVVLLWTGLMFWAPSASAGPPVGGCPTAEWQLRASPVGHANADVNGDGLSCWLEAPEGGGIFTIIDNVVARP